MKIVRLILLWLACASPAVAQSGYHSCTTGTDLDSVFAAWHSGWPQAAATGFHVLSGGDINSRYATLSMGTAASATCNHIAGGADLNTVFAAAGSTNVTISTQPSAVSGSAAAGYPSGTVTSSSTSCAAIHGNTGAYSYTWHIASGSASPTAPSSSTSAVTGTVSAGATDTGTEYCTISDGVTSANSDTVGWSLQNTTPATWSYSGTVTVANASTFYGFSIPLELGAISPTTINGNTITGLITNTGDAQTTFSVSVAYNPGQAIFTQLRYGGITLLSANASYSYSGGVANWTWSEDLFAATGTAAITIN